MRLSCRRELHKSLWGVKALWGDGRDAGGRHRDKEHHSSGKQHVHPEQPQLTPGRSQANHEPKSHPDLLGHDIMSKIK